jgi:hypothetical protein
MPVVTFENLFWPAMRKAGITKLPGVKPGTDQYAEGYLAMNRFMGTMNINKATIFETVISDFVWPANQQSQTFGPTGNQPIAQAPVFIDAANWVLPQSTNPEVLIHMRIAKSDAEFAQLSIPRLGMTFPFLLWNSGASNDSTDPNSRIYVYPVPQQESTLKLYQWVGLKHNFSAKTDQINLQDGWESAIIDAFALYEICPLYGVDPKPALVAAGKRAMRLIRAWNTSSPPVYSDAANLNGSAKDDLAYRISFLSAGQA